MRTLMPLTIALLLATAAAAQSPGPTQSPELDRFKAYIASEPHRELVKRAIATIPTSILPRCPALVSNSSRVIPMAALAMAPDGVPTSGAWKEEFPVSGCGPSTVVNLFFTANPGKGVDAVAGLLGTTHADLTLQRDALPIARMGAGRVTSICPTLAVSQADFEQMGRRDGTGVAAGPAGKQPWWETWTLTGCGLTIDLAMEFVPDATGTQILQSSRGVRQR